MILNPRSSPCVSFADELSPSRKHEERPSSVLTDTPSNACSYSEMISKYAFRHELDLIR